MSLSALLGPAVLREVIERIPDNRLNPNGGVWDARVPERPGDTGELTERDYATPLAGDLLALDGRSRDVSEPSVFLEIQKAAKVNSSSRLLESDIELMGRLIRSGGQDSNDRSAWLARVGRIIERRRQSVAITRGLLKAGMALGSFAYARLGVKFGAFDFGMPAQLKLTPTTYWYGANQAANTSATPITDMKALDIEADKLGGAPYDALDVSLAGFLAMVATTQVQNAIRLNRGIPAGQTLPEYQQGELEDIVGNILKKKITVVEGRYNWQDLDGTNMNGRYTPANFAILYRQADVNSGLNWEWINVPLTQAGVAAVAGDNTFGGGLVRGPYEFASYDREEFTWVRFHSVQQGIPVRRDRTVTARIQIASSESGS